MNIVQKFRPDTGLDTPEHCHIIELDNTEDDPECSIAQASVKPGEKTQLHELRDVIERYVILQGEGLVSVGQHPPVAVAQKDVVIIPAGVSQSITNTGKSELVFLCVCTPRFTPGCYITIDQ